MVDRIFERFVQLDPSRRGDGAGLGLTIARGMPRRTGGPAVVRRPRGATSASRCPPPMAGAPAAAAAHATAREKTLVAPI